VGETFEGREFRLNILANNFGIIGYFTQKSKNPEKFVDFWQIFDFLYTLENVQLGKNFYFWAEVLSRNCRIFTIISFCQKEIREIFKSNRSRVKFIFDDGTNQASFEPNFNVCACRQEANSLCDYDNPKSEIENLFLAGCICTDAFEGRFCEEDKDGCEDPNPPCFPGTECTDQKAPLSGHNCGFCPPGYSGNGFECTADFEEAPQNQICFDFPKIEHGRVVGDDGTNADRGLAAGEILQYICDDGYEMIGASDLQESCKNSWPHWKFKNRKIFWNFLQKSEI